MSRTAAALFLLVALAPVAASALIRVGELAVGAGDVEVVGHLAYLSDYAFGLRIVDVSEPAAPVQIGGLEAPGAYDVAVEGSLAFLRVGMFELRVIDVSDPAHPVQRGTFTDVTCQGRVTAVGRRVYTGGLELCVLDVSRPSQPRKLGQLRLYGYVDDVEVVGDLAYVALSTGLPVDVGALQIVDVSRPKAPVLLGTAPLATGAYGVSIAGHVAWMARRTALTALDVSDPRQPRELGSVDVASSFFQLAHQGSLGVIGAGAPGIQAFDLSDPTAPRALGSLDTPGWADGVALVGDLVFVADGFSLQVIDASHPAKPVERAGFATPAPAVAVALAGTTAYVASGEWNQPGFLDVLDISPPSGPVLLAELAIPDIVLDVAVSGPLAVLGGEKLRTFDVANPAEPELRGVLDVVALHVSLDGTLALADSRKLDVSDPSEPADLGFLPASGDLLQQGGLVYGAAGWDGLVVIEPDGDAPLATAPDGRAAEQLAVEAGQAYLAERDDFEGARWLRVVDATDPAAPVTRSAVRTPHGVIHDVAVASERAYLATSPSAFSGNVVALDVSDPEHPTELGAFATGGADSELAVGGGLVYVADGAYGLRALDFGPEYEGPREAPPLIAGLQIGREKLAAGPASLSVALLGSDRIAVENVDAASLRLGPAGAATRGKLRLRDVNGDGRRDLVARFDVVGAALGSGPTQICVRGVLTGGRRILGCGPVSVLPD